MANALERANQNNAPAGRASSRSAAQFSMQSVKPKARNDHGDSDPTYGNGWAILRHAIKSLEPNSSIVVTSRPSPLNQANFFTAQLVRNSRYQQLAEGIERTYRRELERHQVGFADSKRAWMSALGHKRTFALQ